MQWRPASLVWWWIALDPCSSSTLDHSKYVSATLTQVLSVSGKFSATAFEAVIETLAQAKAAVRLAAANMKTSVLNRDVGTRTIRLVDCDYIVSDDVVLVPPSL
jgi:hypothetical protein